MQGSIDTGLRPSWNVAVSFSQWSQPADFAIARDSSKEVKCRNTGLTAPIEIYGQRIRLLAPIRELATHLNIPGRVGGIPRTHSYRVHFGLRIVIIKMLQRGCASHWRRGACGSPRGPPQLGCGDVPGSVSGSRSRWLPHQFWHCGSKVHAPTTKSMG